MNADHCLNTQGLPQSIQLTFTERVIPKRISLTFQGGFVGIHCGIYIDPDTDRREWRLLTSIYPEDVNRKQSFDLHPLEPGDICNGVRSVKLLFEKSSDFYGRITIYDLKLEGIMTA